MKHYIYFFLLLSLLACEEEETKPQVSQEKFYPLTVNIIGNGTVEEKVVGSTKSSQDYSEGTNVQLTAKPSKEWWSFDKWTGDFVSVDTSITVSVKDTMVINAYFSESNYFVRTNEITVHVPSIPKVECLSATFTDVSGNFHYASEGNEYMLYGGKSWAEDRYNGSIDVETLYNTPTLVLKRINQQWLFHKAYEEATMINPRNFKFIDESSFVIGDAAEFGRDNTKWLGNAWYGRISGDDISWVKVNSIEDKAYYHGITAGDLNNDGLVDFGGCPHPNIKLFTQNVDGSYKNIDSLMEYPQGYWVPFTLEFADVVGDDRDEIITASSGDPYPEHDNNVMIFAFDDEKQKFIPYFISQQPKAFFNHKMSGTSIKVDDFNNDGIKDLSIAREWDSGNNATSYTSFETWLGNGDGTFNPNFSKIFNNNELQFREFSVMDVNHDGFQDIILRPFHFGSLYRINPEWWNLQNTKGVILNHLIWLNNGDATFDYFSKYDLTIEGALFDNAFPFMRGRNLHFIGNQTLNMDSDKNEITLRMYDIKVRID